MFNKTKPGSQEFEDLVTYRKKFYRSLFERYAAEEIKEEQVAASEEQQSFEIKVYPVDVRFRRADSGPSLEGSFPPGSSKISSSSCTISDHQNSFGMEEPKRAESDKLNILGGNFLQVKHMATRMKSQGDLQVSTNNLNAEALDASNPEEEKNEQLQQDEENSSSDDEYWSCKESSEYKQSSNDEEQEAVQQHETLKVAGLIQLPIYELPIELAILRLDLIMEAEKEEFEDDDEEDSEDDDEEDTEDDDEEAIPVNQVPIVLEDEETATESDDEEDSEDDDEEAIPVNQVPIVLEDEENATESDYEELENTPEEGSVNVTFAAGNRLQTQEKYLMPLSRGLFKNQQPLNGEVFTFRS